MTKVANQYGKEIDFEAAINIADREICEKLHFELAPCSEQKFFDAYCEAHEAKYGEDFEPNKLNGQW